MSGRSIYKGYTFVAVSTQTERGTYRSRVAIVALDGTHTRSQRFLDLEIFQTKAEANDRAMTAAKAWIDANAGNDQLALPTNLGAL